MALQCVCVCVSSPGSWPAAAAAETQTGCLSLLQTSRMPSPCCLFSHMLRVPSSGSRKNCRSASRTSHRPDQVVGKLWTAGATVGLQSTVNRGGGSFLQGSVGQNKMLNRLLMGPQAIVCPHRVRQVTPPSVQLSCDANTHHVCLSQGAELSLRQLAEDKSSLQFQLKQLEGDKQQLLTQTRHSELEHTLSVELLHR